MCVLICKWSELPLAHVLSLWQPIVVLLNINQLHMHTEILVTCYKAARVYMGACRNPCCIALSAARGCTEFVQLTSLWYNKALIDSDGTALD